MCSRKQVRCNTVIGGGASNEVAIKVPIQFGHRFAMCGMQYHLSVASVELNGYEEMRERFGIDHADGFIVGADR